MTQPADDDEPRLIDTDWDAYMASRAKPPRSIRYQLAWVALLIGCGLICKLLANAVSATAFSGLLATEPSYSDGMLTSFDPPAGLLPFSALLTMAGSALLCLGIIVAIAVAFRWAKTPDAMAEST